MRETDTITYVAPLFTDALYLVMSTKLHKRLSSHRATNANCGLNGDGAPPKGRMS